MTDRHRDANQHVKAHAKANSQEIELPESKREFRSYERIHQVFRWGYSHAPFEKLLDFARRGMAVKPDPA